MYESPSEEICLVNFGNAENATKFIESFSIDYPEFGGLVTVCLCLQEDKDRWNKFVTSWKDLHPVRHLPVQKPVKFVDPYHIDTILNENAKYQNYINNANV